jgi:hypothetical protein
MFSFGHNFCSPDKLVNISNRANKLIIIIAMFLFVDATVFLIWNYWKVSHDDENKRLQICSKKAAKKGKFTTPGSETLDFCLYRK